MKIYALSLQKETHRRDYINKHLLDLNQDYEIINAIDGREYTKEQKLKLVDNRYLDETKYHFRNGEIGCAFTHMKAYKRLIYEGLECALIVEDDVVLPVNISEILNDLEKIKDFNLILLSFYSHNTKEPLIIKESHLISKNSKLYEVENINRLGSGMAYIISNKFAEKILEINNPMFATADSWGKFLKDNENKKIFCLYPAIVKEKDFISSIDYSSKESVLFKISRFIKSNNIFFLKQLIDLKNYLKLKNKHKVKILKKEYINDYK